MRNKTLLFLALLVLLSNGITAQNEKIFWNYNVSHGLPTNNLYHVFVDSKDRVWFGSDYGVTCYNGAEFRTYTTKDGLKNNTVLRCYEDALGRIWFQYLFEPPSYFKDGKITHLKLSTDKIEITSLNRLCETSDGRLFIYAIYRNEIGGLLTINKDGEGEFKKLAKYPKMAYTLFVENDSLIITGDYVDVQILNKITPTKKYYSPVKINIISVRNEFRKNNVNYDKAEFCRSAKDFEFEDIDISRKFENEKLYHITSNGNKKYYSTSNGIYCFERINQKLVFDSHILKNKTIIAVDFDTKNNLWATSLNSGLYFVPNLSYSVYTLNGNAQCMFSNQIEKMIIVGGEFFPINSYSNGKITPFLKFEESEYTERVLKQIIDHKKNMIFLGTGVWKYYSSEEGQISKIDIGTSSGYIRVKHDRQNENNFFFFGGSTLGELDLSKKNKSVTKLLTAVGRIFCVQNEYDKVFYGTFNGLQLYQNGKSKAIKPSVFKKTRINGLHIIKNTLLIGTAEKGIWGYDLKTKKLTNYSTSVLSPEIKGLFPGQREHEFWVHTSLGIQKFRLDNNTIHETYQIDQKTKLKINDILNLHEIDDQLIISTNSQLFTLDLKVERLTKLPLFINSLKINDKLVVIKSNYNLKPNQNNLNFILDAVNHSKHAVLLLYRINGGKWITNNSSRFNFQSLSPGKYTFEFKAETPFSKVGYISPIEINIAENWWQKTVFQLICFVLSLIFVGLIVRWRINKTQNRKRRILSNELLGLQSQMNPHFTFNSLNSIQSYLSNNDKRSAQIYLADFAILMRKILEQAKLSLIPIEEEIDFLRQYLNLEKRRLNNSFSYEISVDESINRISTKIPTLMLQPFVENAIWHGVAALEYPGEINISIHTESNNLICEIKDNGAGLNSSKNNKPYHKSTGIENCKERMSLFKELHGKDMTLEIIDHVQNNSTGVTVRLTIPNIKLED